jgi:carbonic anhydrase
VPACTHPSGDQAVWQHPAVPDSRNLDGRPAKQLAIVTCMDARIDPLRALGFELGDAVVLRNAGAHVTDDVLRSLDLAQRLLGVERVVVVAHTDCRAAAASEEDADPATRARADVDRLASSGLAASAAVYDVATGRLSAA